MLNIPGGAFLGAAWRQLRKLSPVALTALIVLIVAVSSAAPSRPGNSFSLTTPDRLEDAGWWPTMGSSARTDYVEGAACLQCHRIVADLQKTTAMYHAAARAAQSTILIQHDRLSFHEGSYNYSLTSAESGVTFSVTDSTNSASEQLDWAFGVGHIGQTYLFKKLKKDERYYEGRLSYYANAGGLDITTGQFPGLPSDIEQAMGNRLTTDAARRCFSCHTTAAIVSGSFDPEGATPGVTCQACHGPGAKHVAAMTAQQYQQASATITNPASMSPSDSVDFCGACHRTSADVGVLMAANIGLTSLRFAPYRLEKSRCWESAGEVRITCIACHDPHRPLVRELRAYDTKCLACHLLAGQQPHGKVTTAACKVSSSNCASCHMPKYEVPQTHAKFTDHYIRVVRAGEHFPS